MKIRIGLCNDKDEVHFWSQVAEPFFSGCTTGEVILGKRDIAPISDNVFQKSFLRILGRKKKSAASIVFRVLFPIFLRYEFYFYI